MIKFSRDESKVTIHVQHGIFRDETGFSLDIEQHYPYQAELLRQAFQENLNRHLKEIKEKYYNEGWREAKAKRKKRTDFYGSWKY